MAMRSLRQCVTIGLLMATAFTVLAAIGGGIGGGLELASHGPDELRHNLHLIPVAVVAIVGSYYVAGVLGGIAYFFLQSLTGSYPGQVLLAFVLGGIGYGAIGLTGTLAYVYFGLNMFDFDSPAEAWHLLPFLTLGLAVGTAVLGPLVWRAKS